jgi:hypothetical protein
MIYRDADGIASSGRLKQASVDGADLEVLFGRDPV